ncbi:3'-5' exonuclease [Roseivivax sp. CAU 1753]
MKSLRLRILLLFATALGFSLAAVAMSLRLVPEHGLATAFVAAAFLLLAILTASWFVLDQTMAKPIDRLAAGMRNHAHNDSAPMLDIDFARHLGDLAPAADAVTRRLGQATLSTAEAIAHETRLLNSERERLTALLTEIPVATILASENDTIVLYDGQAAEVLAQIGTPRLNAHLTDYFTQESLARARDKLNKTGMEVIADLNGKRGALVFTARLKPMREGGYLLIIDSEDARISPDADRPLVYDFRLMDSGVPRDFAETPLSDMTYCVFDLETTGLLPHRDEIIQIGALRVMRGRIIEGERINMLVNPGRPIPEASTRVHHIHDAMVRGKPGIVEAAPHLHEFASGAVLVAHNAPFDIAFLKAKRAETGLEWSHPVVDTVLVSAVLFGTTEVHTLDALCTRLGIVIPAALRHTALGDAHATAEALCRMLPMLSGRGIDTFGALLMETRRHGRLIQDLN